MSSAVSPFSVGNVRLFLLFRTFFHARFYYAVYTILFLDLGLTLEQFALLNVLWAVVIVTCEVPSGALADVLGRKPLLVAAGVLMIAEMALIAFVPTTWPPLLFLGAFALNRICSGMAEAAASGADEALAYDSLKEKGLEKRWSHVLERQVQLQSGAFVVALILGAAVYDPAFLNGVLAFFGFEAELTRAETVRLPIFLTLGTSFLVLLAALFMHEPPRRGESPERSWKETCHQIACSARDIVVRAGGWIVRTPFALALIVAGFLFDSIVRVFLTLDSQYLRSIELPESLFGVVQAVLVTGGLVVPMIANRLVRHATPATNFLLLAALTLAGLLGLVPLWPWGGLLPMGLLYAVMFFLGFFLSTYLNALAPSEERATILSFRGLSFNLAYGALGLLYSGLLALLEGPVTTDRPALKGTSLESALFEASLPSFPIWFALAATVFALWARHHLRADGRHRRKGAPAPVEGPSS